MNETKLDKDIAIQNAINQLDAVLIEGEHFEAVAEQHRLFTILPILYGGSLFPLFHRRRIIAATNGRFIIMNRKLIRGYDIVAFRWQDIAEVHLNIGIFGADLTITFYDAEDLSLSKNNAITVRLMGLRREVSKSIYRIAQLQDQSWREKRRIRSLEELRAKSGGVHLSSPMGNYPQDPNDEDKNIRRLQQAKRMLDEKLISDTEYETLKAKIINQI